MRITYSQRLLVGREWSNRVIALHCQMLILYLNYQIYILFSDISKEVNLPELYRYALTEALQTNFTLTEAAIDRIHWIILRELKTKCKNLVKEGLVTDEDLSRKLGYQVAPILQEAKRANKKREFSWNAGKIKGLYKGFSSPVYDYQVVEGEDNDTVVKKIRQ
jgi:hypothetical protein